MKCVTCMIRDDVNANNSIDECNFCGDNFCGDNFCRECRFKTTGVLLYHALKQSVWRWLKTVTVPSLTKAFRNFVFFCFLSVEN